MPDSQNTGSAGAQYRALRTASAVTKGKNPLGIAGNGIVVQPEIAHCRLQIRYTPRRSTCIGKGAIVVIAVASAPAAGINIDIARIQIRRYGAIAIRGCRRLSGIAGSIDRQHHGRSFGSKAVYGSVRIDRAGIGAVAVIRAGEIGAGHHHRQGFVIQRSRLAAILHANLIVYVIVGVIAPLCKVKCQSGKVHLIVLDQGIVVDLRFRLFGHLTGCGCCGFCGCRGFHNSRSRCFRCFCCRLSGSCGTF